MGEAEGMSGLMRGELAGALEHHGEHGVAGGWERLAVQVGAQEGLVDEVVLTAAKGAEGYIACDDLACAGIDDGSTVAPAAGVAMDPLDHVVADVHGVGAGRQDVSLEGAFGPTGGLEGLVPPACAFEERGADGFGCAAIDVVLDGIDGFAVCLAVRILLEEAMADDELLVEGFADRCVVVAIRSGEVAGARVEAARREAGAGEFDKGLMFADGEGVGVGRDVADKLTTGWAVSGEGEDGFDLGVLRESLCRVEGDGGACWVNFVRSLLSASQRGCYFVGVAEEEVGGVDNDSTARILGFDLKAVEDRLGKRLADGQDLVGIGRGGAEALIRFDEEDLRAGALEVDELAG